MESIINQTVLPDELIIVDDKSTDRTFQILQIYEKKYNFIKLFRNEQNLRPNKNFEKGLEISTGDLIFFSDQDDIWDLNKIKEMSFEIGDKDFLYSDAFIVDSRGNAIAESEIEFFGLKPVYGKNPFYFLSTNCVSGHNLLISSRLANLAIPFSSSILFDQWLALIASIVYDVNFINAKLAKHRMHEQNFINNKKIRVKVGPPKKKEMRKERILAKNIKYKNVVMDLKSHKITGDFFTIISDHYENFYKRFFNFKLFAYLFKNRNLVYESLDFVSQLDKSIRFCRCAKGYWIPGIKF